MLVRLTGFLIAPLICQLALGATLSTSKFNYGTGICGNELYSLPGGQVAQMSLTNLQEQADILERLKNEKVVIKLAVFYDRSLAASFSDFKELERFVRNFIFNVQLIYEQPELSSNIKFNLVVISMRELREQFPGWASSRYILDLFTESNNVLNPDADLNILLNFRNFHDGNQNSNSKILGLAYIGTFCNNSPFSTLLTVGYTYTNSYNLAHEIGHSLGLNHDGDDSEIFRDCKTGHFIMNPFSGGIVWSQCSIRSLQVQLTSLSSCVFNSSRLATAVPLNSYFDFSQPPEMRTNLPGQDEPLDKQCELAFRTPAFSDYAKYGQNALKVETCKDLTCSLDNTRLRIAIGPALYGSACTTLGANVTLGTCYNGRCNIS